MRANLWTRPDDVAKWQPHRILPTARAAEPARAASPTTTVRTAALTFDEALQAAQVGEVWATLDQLVETLKTVWYQVLFDPEITDKRVACEAAAADFGLALGGVIDDWLGGQTVGKPRDRGGDPSGRDGHAETAGARHGRGDRDEPAEVRGPGVGIVVKGPPDPAGRDLLRACEQIAGRKT